MRILITNDDGIDAIGIIRLAEAAVKLGEVWVVAPDSQRSAASHCVTFGKSFTVAEYDFPVAGVKAYSCSGSPADCVRVGALKLMPEKPDYVFSGINNGFNIGEDVQYSATVGAALEGSGLGIASIAVSLSRDAKDFDLVDEYLNELLSKYMKLPLKKDQIWSINFPACSVAECKGILEDRKVSKDKFYDDGYIVEKLEDGKISFTMNIGRIWEASEGTDIAAIKQNYISIGVVNNVC